MNLFKLKNISFMNMFQETQHENPFSKLLSVKSPKNIFLVTVY